MFEFNEDYKTGFEDIDNQHRKLFSLAEAFDTKIVSSKSDYKDIFEENYSDFKTQMLEHLDFEIKLLEKNKYGRLEEHRSAHDYIKNQLEEIEQVNDYFKRLIMIESLMVKYFVSHIIMLDKDVARFLMDKDNNVDRV